MTFQKGQSGNATGRIRRKPLTDALHALLARPADDPLSDDPKTLAQKIALNLVIMAQSADLQAMRELWDRAEGKAAQSIEHSLAKSHEEQLDELDQDDPSGETTPSPTEG